MDALMAKTYLCEDKDLRACEEYWGPVEGKWVDCKIQQKDGTEVVENVPVPVFMTPRKIGANSFDSPPTSLSRGNAIYQATIRSVS